MDMDFGQKAPHLPTDQGTGVSYVPEIGDFVVVVAKEGRDSTWTGFRGDVTGIRPYDGWTCIDVVLLQTSDGHPFNWPEVFDPTSLAPCISPWKRQES
jgi:hypothetical protein